MNNPMSMLLNMAMQNSNIANNPRAQEMLQVIQSGDAQKGQQIAMLTNTLQIRWRLFGKSIRVPILISKSVSRRI